MKAVKLIQNIGLVFLCSLIFALGVFSQSETTTTTTTLSQQAAPQQQIDKSAPLLMPSEAKPDTGKKTKKEKKKNKGTDTQQQQEQQPPTEMNKQPGGEDVPDAEAAVLPYYNNYLTEYRLGPNDVISVEVFGQCPDYCKEGITVPPTAKISYPLIREGVFVGGKTVEQIQDEIKKKLDEYIIDPQVTVTLNKAMSARYSVLGKVASPGVRIMDRKVSLYEAIVESGGILKDGDKKRITLFRFNGQGRLASQTVNMLDVERGKADMIFLEPGDQVFVPDQGFKLNVDTVFKILEKASVARLLFGSPF